MLNKIKEDLRITGATKVYGIIGDPVNHSFSPKFWNKAFQELQIDAVYVPFRVKPEKLEQAISGLSSLNVKGINVTIPHKIPAHKLCTDLNYPAAELKAVNTIRFTEDKILGWNTDATAFLKILDSLEKKQTVSILGKGGAAKACLWALTKAGFKNIIQISRNTKVFNPDESNSADIKHLEWTEANIENATRDSGLIINATPLGWKEEDRLPGFAKGLSPNKTFIDLNYSFESTLLKTAQQAGAKVIDGRELLLQQGLEAFKNLTDHEPPEKIFRSSIFAN